MIKLEHEVLWSDKQIEFIIEGMRNPMNSWDKSDSHFGCLHFDEGEKEESECCYCDRLKAGTCDNYPPYMIMGNNDLKLMDKLSKAGTDHRKFMRMIPVFIRITAPLYWWKEFDTYKVGTVANSTSTMHKITSKEFTMDDFSTEHLSHRSILCLEDTIDVLNFYRKIYINGGDDAFYDNNIVEHAPKDKEVWYQLIQLLPSSYNQTRNVSLNYEVLANMYKSRKDHKLDEWREFCKWIELLPYSYLITGDTKM